MFGIDFKNLPMALGIVLGGVLVASIGLGLVIALLARFGSRFFKTSLPSDAAQAQFDKAFRAQALSAPRPMNANAEPLIISLVGFLIFLAIGGLLLSQVQGPKPVVDRLPEPASAEQAP
jgi:hypothetical protein